MKLARTHQSPGRGFGYPFWLLWCWDCAAMGLPSYEDILPGVQLMIAQLRLLDETVDVKRLAEQFLDLLPTLDAQAQRVARETYRALAEGDPASVERIAAAADVTPESARDLLELWRGVFWEEGKVTGFWGLSLPPVSKHMLRVEGRTLYAWCAWDTLFIPELIGKTAEIESTDPKSGQAVKLTVSPDEVKTVWPEGTVMSILKPTADMREDIVAKFCHFVHFFPSAEVGEQWVSDNPGTNLMSIKYSFELAKLRNRGKFNEALDIPAN